MSLEQTSRQQTLRRPQRSHQQRQSQKISQDQIFRQTWPILENDRLEKNLQRMYGSLWRNYFQIKMGGHQQRGSTPYLYIETAKDKTVLKEIFAEICASLYLHLDPTSQTLQRATRIKGLSTSTLKPVKEILYFKSNTLQECTQKVQRFFRLKTRVPYTVFGYVHRITLNDKTAYYFVVHRYLKTLNENCVEWFTGTNRDKHVQEASATRGIMNQVKWASMKEPLLLFPPFYDAFQGQRHQGRTYSPPHPQRRQSSQRFS